MAREQYITALDIGTQNLRALQAKVGDDGELNIIGASTNESLGMRKGVIVDIEETVSSLSAVLEKLERMTGVPVTLANVSVGGNHTVCMESKGVIAVSRADGEITEADVIRVIDASQAISIPPNREVLHVIPKTFTLDGQTGIKDPIGMSGIRLEVETILIHGALPYIKNLNKAAMQAGLEIDQLVLAPLAAAQSVLNKRQKELGVAVVDLGAGTTGLAVYEENNLLHTAIIPVGSMHITNDIAIGLRCTIDTAEKVKLLYGHAGNSGVDKREDIDLSRIDPEETESISRSELIHIMEARLEEIFDFVNKELKKINRDGQLPAGIILTGGGAELDGIVEYAKKHLRLPVAIGSPVDIKTVIDQVNDPSFATCVGLLQWAHHYGQGTSDSGILSGAMGLLENKNMLKLKQWFKSFLP